MAIAAPHVKLLRQLAKAKDDYMSGAFDIAWDGGFATIFMVFGQPSHAVYEAGGDRRTGEDALEALLRDLPRQFDVSDWRRAMAPQETLNVSVDDITEPLAELVGEHTQVRDTDDTYAWLGGYDDSPDLGFDVNSFPLLPAGRALWDEGPAEAIGLRDRLAGLTTALIVLTGPRLHAAGVVRDGDLIDAVWVDSADHARGDTAAMALLGAREGTVAGYALDGIDVAEAIPMLWRLPRGDAIDSTWVDAPALVASLIDDQDDHVLLIEGPDHAVGLFTGGAIVAAYTSSDPVPVRTTDQLVELIQEPGTTLRVLQRRGAQPRRVSAQPPAAPPPQSPPAADAWDAGPSTIDAPAWYTEPAESAEAAERADVTAPPEHVPEADTTPGETPTYAAPARTTAPRRAPDLVFLETPSPAVESAPPVVSRDDVDEPAPDPVAEDLTYASSPIEEPAASVSADWVDYDDVRNELVTIAEAWLGKDDAAPVNQVVLATQPMVEDFITTIEKVRRMTVAGHDATQIQTMAREMHVHAAERLCGA